MAITVAGGCRNASTPSPTARPTLAATVLRVACPGPDAVRLIERHGRPWAARAGARLDILNYDPAGNPPADADLWLLTPARLPYFASQQLLRPIPDSYTALTPDNRQGWEDLLPLYRYRLLTWDRVAYAMPVLGEAQLCYYRTDWLSDPDHAAKFEQRHGRKPAPPETWEELVELAEFFKDAGQAASLPALSDRAEEVSEQFFAVAAPHAIRAVAEGTQPLPVFDELYSFQFDLATGQPRLTMPGFVHALHLLQRMQRCRPAGSVPEPETAFRQGQAVLCVASPAWAARFEEADSPVRGKFGCRRLPGSRFVYRYADGKREDMTTGINHVPYLGANGLLGAVPTSAQQPTAALELLADLSSRAVSRQIIMDRHWGGRPTRRSHFDRVEDWYGFGLSGEHTANLQKAVRDGLDPLPINPAIRLRTPDERELHALLAPALHQAIVKDSDATQTLAEINRQWQQRDEKEGSAVRRAVYRLSLGR
ncbi:MAG: extracellular solute-binding protein [Planctomycetia bacterium]|nr:extracellular solute-binding protein [Planctomycetia bacterium]